MRAVVVDIVAPIAIYYGVRGAGGSVWLALAAGGVLPAVSAVADLMTRRHVDVTGDRQRQLVLVDLLLRIGPSWSRGVERDWRGHAKRRTRVRRIPALTRINRATVNAMIIPRNHQ